ncbi:hypothetical protein Tco_0348297 [Tanacetum coccineum]
MCSTGRRSPVPRCNTRAYCATHYCGDWRGSLLEEVAFAVRLFSASSTLICNNEISFSAAVRESCNSDIMSSLSLVSAQRVSISTSMSSSLAVISSGLSSDVSDAGFPSEKVVAFGLPERLASQVFLEWNVPWWLPVPGSCQAERLDLGIVCSWHEEGLDTRDRPFYMQHTNADSLLFYKMEHLRKTIAKVSDIKLASSRAWSRYGMKVRIMSVLVFSSSMACNSAATIAVEYLTISTGEPAIASRLNINRVVPNQSKHQTRARIDGVEEVGVRTDFCNILNSVRVPREKILNRVRTVFPVPATNQGSKEDGSGYDLIERSRCYALWLYGMLGYEATVTQAPRKAQTLKSMASARLG